MKRNFLVIGLCLIALALATPQSVTAATDTVTANGSSTVGNPDGVKKGSGNRTILTLRVEKESGVKSA